MKLTAPTTRTMAIAVPRCLVCSIHLEDPRTRRNLTTESSSTVAQLINELLIRTENEVAVDLFTKKSRFLCRRCFGSFHKFLELSQKLKELDGNLEANVKRAFHQFTSVVSQPDVQSTSLSASSSSPVSHTPGRTSRKRLHDTDPGRSSKQRRMAPNTPTRRFLNQPIVGDSPVLAVRIYIQHLHVGPCTIPFNDSFIHSFTFAGS